MSHIKVRGRCFKLNDNNMDQIKSKQNEGSDTLFPVQSLLRKTADNMAKAEARTKEHPLWTPKTYELERKELEEKRK
jgi:hypothetical protein